jgi:hypothetical protein
MLLSSTNVNSANQGKSLKTGRESAKVVSAGATKIKIRSPTRSAKDVKLVNLYQITKRRVSLVKRESIKNFQRRQSTSVSFVPLVHLSQPKTRTALPAQRENSKLPVHFPLPCVDFVRRENNTRQKLLCAVIALLESINMKMMKHQLLASFVPVGLRTLQHLRSAFNAQVDVTKHRIR